MEVKSILRRSQSEKNVSKSPAISWMDAGLRERRKSVSQLVAQYQCSEDVRTHPDEKEQKSTSTKDEPGDELNSPLTSNETKQQTKEWFSFNGRPNLSRSRSAQYLPQRESADIGALLAVFESKASTGQGFTFHPYAGSTSTANKTRVAQSDTKKVEPKDLQKHRRPPTEDESTATKDEPGDELNSPLTSNETKQQTKEWFSFNGRPNLSRSRSAQYLPQRESADISALLAVFESKASTGQGFTFHPCASMTSTANKTKVAQSDTKTAEIVVLTDMQKPRSPLTEDKEGRRVSILDRMSKISGASLEKTKPKQQDERRESLLDLRDTLSTQGEESLGSVKSRSALYLSKVAAALPSDSPIKRVSVVQDHTVSSGEKNTFKMADKNYQIKVSESFHGISEDDNLVALYPSTHQMENLLITGDQNQVFTHSREAFAAFHRQRRKNEVKRLFRHTHPELKNHGDVMDQELVKVLNSECTEAVADTRYQGEVQSMRWIFENCTLDQIGDHHATETLPEGKPLKRGDRKSFASMVEDQGSSSFQSPNPIENSQQGQFGEDFHGGMLMSKIRRLDSFDKLNLEQDELIEAWLKEPNPCDDIKEVLKLSNTEYSLDCFNSEDSHSLLERKPGAKTQVQERDVQRIIQTVPFCALRDHAGNVHHIGPICREEIQSRNVETAHWLFETQPFKVLNKGVAETQIIQSISLEEADKDKVRINKWMIEAQPLDEVHESPHAHKIQEALEGVDVWNKRQLFETQGLVSAKGEAISRKDIVGGDVRSTLWLFETMENGYKDGHPKKITISEDERGTVLKTKHVFESYTLDSSSKAKTMEENQTDAQKTEKANVKSFKELFEAIPFNNVSHFDKEHIDSINSNDKFKWQKDCPVDGKKENKGSRPNCYTINCVKLTDGSNKNFKSETFSSENKHDKSCEQTPSVENSNVNLYAIRDKDGQFHEVTTITKEVINEDHTVTRWMFETKPLKQNYKEDIFVIQAENLKETLKGDVKSPRCKFGTQVPDTHIESEEAKLKIQQDPHFNKELLEYCLSCHKKNASITAQVRLFENQPADLMRTEHQALYCTEHFHIEKKQKGDAKPCSGFHKPQQAVLDTTPRDGINVYFEGSNCEAQNTEMIRENVSSSKQPGVQENNQPILVKKKEIILGNTQETVESMEHAKMQIVQVACDISVPQTIYCQNATPQETSSSEPNEMQAMDQSNGMKKEITSAGNLTKEIFVLPKIIDRVNVRMQELPSTVLPTKTAAAHCEEHEVEVAQPTSVVEAVFDEQSTELQAAMQRLRQATAEAETILVTVYGRGHPVSLENSKQHMKAVCGQQVESILTARQGQETVAQMEIISCNTKEKPISANQCITSANEKDGHSEEEKSCEKSEAPLRREFERQANLKIDTGGAKQQFSIPSPSLKLDNVAQTSEPAEEDGTVRTDVKALSGVFQAALRSLEKSSINATKGDFKAAMIYRNTEKSHKNNRKKVDVEAASNQKISVTNEEQLLSRALQTAPVANPRKEEPTFSARKNHTQSLHQLPSKTCRRSATQKPALPPKPAWLNTMLSLVPDSIPVPSK